MIWMKSKTTIVYITHDIAEAIMLADRIILLGYRPATIKAVYEVRLPRPGLWMSRNTIPIFGTRKEIWSTIKDEVLMAQRRN